MAYATTLVVSGSGKGLVVATGDRTQVGQIAGLVRGAETLATPLQRRMAKFSRYLLGAVMTLAAAVAAIGLAQGRLPEEAVGASVALAVAMIPEGLPAVITVTLAIGVARMARRHAIIRRLPAVETLGLTTVICSDKTGTLTQNEMTVTVIWAGGTFYRVTGIGYDLTGEVLERESGLAGRSDALHQCVLAGVLCNDSELAQVDDSWKIEGDPTEGCLLVVAHKLGLRPQALRADNPRLDSLPFSPDEKYMATLHGPAPPTIYVKGAVEVVLDRCEAALSANGEVVLLDKEAVLTVAQELAADGLRVLAFAKKEARPRAATLDRKDVAEGLVFLGLQAMLDPPRPEAIKAVAACHEAGIEVRMITGDHVLTARAVADRLALGRPRGLTSIPDRLALTGNELAAMQPDEFRSAAREALVFARVSPDQKLRLVEALQAKGEIVAMTGDGVNDAPALRQADIGIAMGLTGTDAAKEASDMILTDDNFASIEAAVEEGRGVWDNLTKFITWTLPTNLGEGLVVLVALALGSTLPLLP